MNNYHFHSTPCALCGSTRTDDYEIVYPANYQTSDVGALFSARRLPDRIHAQIVKCKRDGQVRSTPVLDQDVLNSLYQRSEFNYQHEVANLTKTYLNALALILPKLKKTDRILEIGCGNGFVLTGLVKQGYTQVYGVEPSQQAVALAPKFLKSRIKIKPFSASLFPKHSFQLIFLMQTLDHIPDPVQFLKECDELLKPGGYILSYHHNVDSWSAKLLGEKSPIFDIEHTYLYSHRTTKLLFLKNRYQVMQLLSPTNSLSIYHLLWLIPFSAQIKKFFLGLSFTKVFQQLSIQIPLGNTCIVAKKK